MTRTTIVGKLCHDIKIPEGEAVIYRLRFEPTGQYYIGRTSNLRTRLNAHYRCILEICIKNQSWSRNVWLPFYRVWADHIRAMHPDGNVVHEHLAEVITMEILHTTSIFDSIHLEQTILVDNISDPLLVNSSII